MVGELGAALQVGFQLREDEIGVGEIVTEGVADMGDLLRLVGVRKDGIRLDFDEFAVSVGAKDLGEGFAAD